MEIPFFGVLLVTSWAPPRLPTSTWRLALLALTWFSATLRKRGLSPAVRQDTVSLAMTRTTPGPSHFESLHTPLGLALDKTTARIPLDKTADGRVLVSLAPPSLGLRKNWPRGQDTGPSETTPPEVASPPCPPWMAAFLAGGACWLLTRTSMRRLKTAALSPAPTMASHKVGFPPSQAVEVTPRRRTPGRRGRWRTHGWPPPSAAGTRSRWPSPKAARSLRIRQDRRPRGGHDGLLVGEEKSRPACGSPGQDHGPRRCSLGGRWRGSRVQ